MTESLEHRFTRLQERQDRLEQRFDAEQNRIARQRRREKWSRLALFAVLGLAYVYYFHWLGSIT